jgi:hypothetical protein
MHAAASEFPAPEGVRTSVTLHELRLLQRYAAGRRVLEIGTHLGFTCIGMALAGAHVISYDPHFEGPADNPDTWGPFCHNCQRHGVLSRVTAYRKPIEDSTADELGPGFGLVFIDGNHVWPLPMRDAYLGLRWVVAPGYLAFHDVTPNWPGVWRTVNELVEAGRLEKLEQAGTLAIYQSSASAVAGKSTTPADML